MRLSGMTLKAINIGLKEHLDALKSITRPAFDLQPDAFDITITENGSEWRIRFAPGEQAVREAKRKSRGAHVAFSEYTKTFVIRKGDFHILLQEDERAG